LKVCTIDFFCDAKLDIFRTRANILEVFNT
jgi:hypothetical protein